MSTKPKANIHFADGTPVPKRIEAEYLGCKLNAKCNLNKEVGKRMADCMAIMQKLHLFWRHANCSIGFKLIVMDAVIRSKPLYGLETAHLGSTLLQRIEVFQLKILRKIKNNKR